MLRLPENSKALLVSFLAQSFRTTQAFDDVYWNKTTPMEGLEAQKPLWEAELEN